MQFDRGRTRPREQWGRDRKIYRASAFLTLTHAFIVRYCPKFAGFDASGGWSHVLYYLRSAHRYSGGTLHELRGRHCSAPGPAGLGLAGPAGLEHSGSESARLRRTARLLSGRA
jgi:hypothetical protein